MKTKIVTGFVPLKVRHLKPSEYDALLDRMLAGLPAGYRLACAWPPFEDLWCYKKHPEWLKLPLAAPRPADRYETDEDNMRSHFVQHNRTTWAMAAAETFPDIDVWVWLDYGIMKQGAWNARPLLPEHVGAFIKEVEATPRWEGIPFPGISPPGPVTVHGNNWRFCGSTHIWPKKFLPLIDAAYKYELERFVREHGCVPLDLAIWPAVEMHSGLPFRWYKAEYDHTQLTEFHRELAL